MPRTLLGDTREILRSYPADYFESVVTDPPYGLSSEPDVLEVMRHWIRGDKYVHSDAGGFMGKTWDSFVPGPEYWREVYRVLKPGAHLLAFASTRTWDLLSIALRFAGFENRDTIRNDGPPGVGWIRGQGFPKSQNVGKAIDKLRGAERRVIGVRRNTYDGSKRDPSTHGNPAAQSNIGEWGLTQTPHGMPETAPATEEAARWEGWGTALRPCWEVILVFRKPVSSRTLTLNVLQYGAGAINVDASRLPSGRWPANVVFCHLPGCQFKGFKRVKGIPKDKKCKNTGTRASDDDSKVYQGGWKPIDTSFGFAGADGFERVEQWECVEGCPVAEMDRQSGNVKGGSPVRRIGTKRKRPSEHSTNNAKEDSSAPGYLDSGGASRFFYCARAAKGERNIGLPPWLQNRHPTVKPVKLCEYLVRLVTPVGGTVLDPFMGSGTMGVAAVDQGFNFVGIDNDRRSHTIAAHRVYQAGLGLPMSDDGAYRFLTDTVLVEPEQFLIELLEDDVRQLGLLSEDDDTPSSSYDDYVNELLG